MPSFYRLGVNEYSPMNSSTPDDFQCLSTASSSTDVTTKTTPSATRETEHGYSDELCNSMETNSRNGSGEERTIIPRIHGSQPLLNVLTLTILVFYNVSGGPFGVEAAVRAGGNRMALLGFLIGPLVWSLQEVSSPRSRFRILLNINICDMK